MKNFKKSFKILQGKILDAVYPPRCTGCGEILVSGALCENCRKSMIPISQPVCLKCGSSLNDHDSLECNEISAPVVGAYYYGGVVKKLILALKNGTKDEALDEFFDDLCEKISKVYADVNFDIAVCVPSYDKNEYNASVEIAKRLSRAYFLEFDRYTLEKYRQTQKQHMLTQKERMENLKSSIRVTSGKEEYVKGKTVLLCDDVKSTGSTLDECAKALYFAGAKKVYCVCIAISDYIRERYAVVTK